MLLGNNKLLVELKASTIPGLGAMRPAETSHHAQLGQRNIKVDRGIEYGGQNVKTSV